MANENLWSRLVVPEDETSPKSILEKIGKDLTEQTKGILRGKTDTGTYTEIYDEKIKELAPKTQMKEMMICRLNIYAPYLNNYNLQFLTVRYSLFEFYPVKLEDMFSQQIYKLKNKQEYEEKLKEIIQSDIVTQVTSNLLIQSMNK